MKKILLIFTLVPVVIVIVIIFVLLPNGTSPQPTENIAIPTQSPLINTSQPTLPAENKASPLALQDFIQLLPYSTPDFDVEYLTTSDSFIITLKNPPAETTKTAALSWITSQGVDPSKLRILYNSYRWVQ